MDTNGIQSKEHRDLLDIIDRLRSEGFGNHVDLPEIVVCGDQSAGKSSVLEAISGISFPMKDNLCTRFATELVLRRQKTPAIRVSIIPGPERSAEERHALGRFHADVDANKPDIAAVIDKAKVAMGLSDAKLFSTDILRLEICGPSQPHLTMVDLPGLFRARSGEQTLADAAVVRSMVLSYAKRPRSIILAVVSARNDFALQEITEVARKLDPDGIRTLGLITKPDMLDVGSDSEAAYVKLAQNKDVEFRLGWHVLKNRNYEMRDATSAERDASEEKFFRTGAWAAMRAENVGVSSLKPRLSNVLRDQILQQLPNLLHDVTAEITNCKAQLQRLGTPRTNAEDQRRYLFQVSREYTLLMQAAVDGEYNHSFFGRARTEEGSRRRLRARVQNSLDHFAEDMRLYGEAQILLDDTLEEEEKLPSSRHVRRSEYIENVKNLMKKSRGRELSGTFNPLIIGELFKEQCSPWKGLVDNVKEEILLAIAEVTDAIVNHVAAEDTVTHILSTIRAAGAVHRRELDTKIKTLLEPHLDGHPITYNHYMTDTVQKSQADRRGRELAAAFQDILGAENFKKSKKLELCPHDLYNKLRKRTQVDMQLYAGELATDYMEAYYKVACKKLIDDVSVLAVEGCLVGKLSSLFQAEAILDLTKDELGRLAQEEKSSAKKRLQCKEKLSVLEAGKEHLYRLEALRPPSSAPRMPGNSDLEISYRHIFSFVDDDTNSSAGGDDSGEEHSDGVRAERPEAMEELPLRAPQSVGFSGWDWGVKTEEKVAEDDVWGPFPSKKKKSKKV